MAAPTRGRRQSVFGSEIEDNDLREVVHSTEMTDLEDCMRDSCGASGAEASDEDDDLSPVGDGAAASHCAVRCGDFSLGEIRHGRPVVGAPHGGEDIVESLELVDRGGRGGGGRRGVSLDNQRGGAVLTINDAHGVTTRITVPEIVQASRANPPLPDQCEPARDSGPPLSSSAVLAHCPTIRTRERDTHSFTVARRLDGAAARAARRPALSRDPHRRRSDPPRASARALPCVRRRPANAHYAARGRAVLPRRRAALRGGVADVRGPRARLARRPRARPPARARRRGRRRRGLVRLVSRAPSLARLRSRAVSRRLTQNLMSSCAPYLAPSRAVLRVRAWIRRTRRVATRDAARRPAAALRAPTLRARNPPPCPGLPPRPPLRRSTDLDHSVSPGSRLARAMRGVSSVLRAASTVTPPSSWRFGRSNPHVPRPLFAAPSVRARHVLRAHGRLARRARACG